MYTIIILLAFFIVKLPSGPAQERYFAAVARNAAEWVGLAHGENNFSV